MGNILITGASGRVGSSVIRHLRHESYPTRVVVGLRDPSVWRGVEQPVALDFHDPSTFSPALEGISQVFLMRPPRLTGRRDLVPFLDACVVHEVRRVVVLSVYKADRISALPHHAMETEVRRRPFEHVMLRPADFMQNLETVLLDDIVHHDRIAVPAGLGRSAFVDVEDVGAVAARLLVQDGGPRTLTLTGPDALDFEDVARVMSQVLERRIRYEPPSLSRFLYEHMSVGSAGWAAIMAAVYSVQRLGLSAPVTDDVERVLGRKPYDLAMYLTRRAEIFAATQHA